MMIFNMSTSYFSQNFISLFWGLFHDQTDFRNLWWSSLIWPFIKKMFSELLTLPKIKLMLFNLTHFVVQKVGLFIKKYEMKCGCGARENKNWEAWELWEQQREHLTKHKFNEPGNWGKNTRNIWGRQNPQKIRSLFNTTICTQMWKWQFGYRV